MQCESSVTLGVAGVRFFPHREEKKHKSRWISSDGERTGWKGWGTQTDVLLTVGNFVFPLPRQDDTVASL